VLEVVAEGGQEQGEALAVGHGAHEAAGVGEGVGGLGHVGDVSPVVVGVARHPPPHHGHEVVDRAPPDPQPPVQLQLRPPPRSRTIARSASRRRRGARGGGGGGVRRRDPEKL
jgi:hypothetical protein